MYVCDQELNLQVKMALGICDERIMEMNMTCGV